MNTYASTPLDISHLSVLVVDDEPEITEIISDCLSELNLKKVITAQNGADALAAFECHHFHVIFTDVNMPVMSGLEFLSRVANLPLKQRPVVLIFSSDQMIKGKIENEDQIKSLVCGIFSKPFRVADIVDAITLAALKLEVDFR